MFSSSKYTKPEFQLPNDARAYVARRDPDARVCLEVVPRGLENPERHSNGMQVVVLVGAPWCSERVQQNKSCAPHAAELQVAVCVHPFESRDGLR